MPGTRLTAAALLCRCLSWFPVWLLLLSVPPPEHRGMMLAALTFCSLLTAFLTRIVSLRFRPRRFVLLLCRLSGTACCAALLHLVLGLGLLRAVLLPLVTIAVSARNTANPPEALYPMAGYTAFLTGTVLVPVFLWLSESAGQAAALLPVTGLISALFFLLRNQTMLHRMVNRRSRTETAVPKDIARGNLLLVCGIILSLTLLFLLRTPMLALLRLLKQGCILLVRGLLHGIVTLVSVMSGGEAKMNEIPSAAESTPSAIEKSNPLWSLLWIPFIAVAVYMWHQFLNEWFWDLRTLLAGMFRQKKAAPAKDPAASEASYTDSETILRPQQNRRRQKRAWKKQLRAWRQMPDSTEKFYRGYALLLTAPAWGTEPPEDSRTVQEIADAWAARSGNSLLAQVTADYHAHRYAGCALPADAIVSLGRVLRTMQSEPDTTRHSHTV